MSPTKRLLAVLCLPVASMLALAQYAPTPPTPIFIEQKPAKTELRATAPAQYSIGEPTDEEQMHLELINRARADANTEALRLLALDDPATQSQIEFFQVDTNLMKQQFATNPPAAPLSMNANLTTAARAHSQFQFDNAIQTHTGAGGSSPGDRAQAAGYSFSGLGENVFLNAESVEHGHAAFEIDWGPGPGGMQTPPGHRNSIHNRNFVEVGIGIVKGTKTIGDAMAGPQVVTEDFGRPGAATTFITGVAYYDLNSNNFYDLGEGLPGVRVTVDGQSTFAITATSGGYSIPVPPNASYTVRFNVTGLPETTSTLNLTADNAKRDFKPSYTAPTIASGPSPAAVGVENIYNITTVPGATGYRTRVTQSAPIPLEGAEGNLDHLTITTFGGYPFVSTSVKASGSASFHLGHMVDNGDVHAQIIQFNQAIRVGTGGRVDFKSLVAVAGDGQFASLEISEDNGQSWDQLWTQAGAGVAGEETQFSLKSISLAAYEGETIRARFVLDANGSLFILPPPNDPSFDRIGWYVDDILFVNAEGTTAGEESQVLTEPRFSFTPAATGDYFLEFQAVSGGRTFPYGPAQKISAQPNVDPPSVSLVNNVTLAQSTVTLQFTLTAGNATSFSLETAPSILGPWSREDSAIAIGPVEGRYTITAPRFGVMQFYRIGAN